MTAEGVFPKVDGDILYASEATAFAPTGCVMAWLKSYTNTPALPDSWVECNGQVLSDAKSPYNGQTIPDLNGTTDTDKLFLRGATSSGGTGGSATHYHTAAGGTVGGAQAAPSSVTTKLSDVQPNIPPYYEVVWIMRIR